MINTRGTYSLCHYYFPALLPVQVSYARKMKNNTKLVLLVIFQMRPTKRDLRNTKRGIVFVYSISKSWQVQFGFITFPIYACVNSSSFLPQLRFMHFINHLATIISQVSFSRVNQSNPGRLLRASHGKVWIPGNLNYSCQYEIFQSRPS